MVHASVILQHAQLMPYPSQATSPWMATPVTHRHNDPTHRRARPRWVLDRRPQRHRCAQRPGPALPSSTSYLAPSIPETAYLTPSNAVRKPANGITKALLPRLPQHRHVHAQSDSHHLGIAHDLVSGAVLARRACGPLPGAVSCTHSDEHWAH